MTDLDAVKNALTASGPPAGALPLEPPILHVEFNALRLLERGSKSELWEGTWRGAPAVAKRLKGADPFWRTWLRREIALLRAFDEAPPPVHAPRLLHGDEDASLLIMTRVEGQRLATRRYASRALPSDALASLLAALEALPAWAMRPITAPAPPQAARRMMPDPADPLVWAESVFAQAHTHSLLDAAGLKLACDALRHVGAAELGHGDMLLRNALWDGAQLGLVDWEFAGPLPTGWDLALLWIGLTDPDRRSVETLVRGWTAPRRAMFDLSCLLAAVRELKVRLLNLRQAPTSRAVVRLRQDQQVALQCVESSCS